MREHTAFPRLRAIRSIALLLAAALPTTALAEDVPAAQVETVPPQPSSQPPPMSDAVQAAAVTALMAERSDWQGRNTSILGPLVFTIAGGAVLLLGVGLQALYQDSGGCDDSYPGDCTGPLLPKDEALNTASIVTLIAGAAVLGTGGVWWLLRTSEGRQQQELHRIDDRLKTFGVQASLTPWFVPRTSQVAGASGGLHLSLQF